MECTSPKTGGTADVVVIGFSVGLARLATLSAALFEVARSRVADGISTSSTSPLEVSSVYKGSGQPMRVTMGWYEI
jgi:hypothetical protein